MNHMFSDCSKLESVTIGKGLVSQPCPAIVNYIQRWHVDNGTLVQDSSLNYTSMSGASTLEDFIEYGIEEYPAEKTGFIFWQ